MTAHMLRGVLATGALALSACGGGGDASPPPPATTLQSIAISPGPLTESAGSAQPLTATGRYSDGTSKDVTASAAWMSSATAVATVSGGLVTGMSGGAATITASLDGVSGSDTVTILAGWKGAASAPLVLQAQTATLLQDGTVLVDGGDPTQTPPGAAVYDPVTDTWSATGPPATVRYDASATLLKDGRVLVAGGDVLDVSAPPGSNQTIILASAELYDPLTKTWSAAADMPTPRHLHAAVLLPSGRVLVVGGDDANSAGLADALLYDPATNTWTASTTLATPNVLPTATVLTSGKVLVTVNQTLSQSEIYDPASGTWSQGPNMINNHYLGATATLLADGRVLVAGGETPALSGNAMSVPELYDPVAGSWSAAGTMATGRVAHSATLLPGGQVLVAGGYGLVPSSLSSAELYDPAANSWSPAASMPSPRDHHGAVLLPQGSVFVTGGANQGAVQLTSALYR